MTRRDMTIQATLAFSLILGIVGGNFVLHRWVLGNAASREADAGTASASLSQDDLDEFPPIISSVKRSVDPAKLRERLRKLIAAKLPNASDEERGVWLEELSDVSLLSAEGILELRRQDSESSAIDGTRDSNPSGTEPLSFEFRPAITR